MSAADTGTLVTANLSRNEVALWAFAGFFGVTPNPGRSTEDAIRDVLALPGGEDAWARCQRVADNVLHQLAQKFAPGVPQ